MYQQGLKVESIGRSVLRKIMSVRKAIHWVSAIQERGMSQQAEELVRSGQPRNFIKACILSWEITTIAGIQMIIPMVFGVTPLTQIRIGSTALSLHVRQQ